MSGVDAERAVLAYTGQTARIRFLFDKPVGAHEPGGCSSGNLR